MFNVCMTLPLLLLVLATPSNDWTVVTQQDGITVSKQANASQELLQFRAEALIEAPINQVVGVLLDFARRPEWVPSCVSTEVLERPQPNVAIVYSYTKSPPLVNDRDAVFEARTTLLPSDKTVEIRFRDVQDARKPPQAGVARVGPLAGLYRVHQVANNRTAVLYEFMADPGGSIPSWIVNAAGKDAPLQTLLGLRQQVARGTHPEALAETQERLQWHGF